MKLSGSVQLPENIMKRCWRKREYELLATLKPKHGEARKRSLGERTDLILENILATLEWKIVDYKLSYV